MHIHVHIHRRKIPRRMINGKCRSKEFIESIIAFKGDGSGVITCPLRCAKETVVNQIVNNFAATNKQ